MTLYNKYTRVRVRNQTSKARGKSNLKGNVAKKLAFYPGVQQTWQKCGARIPVRQQSKYKDAKASTNLVNSGAALKEAREL